MNDNTIGRLGESIQIWGQIWGAASETDDLGNPVKAWTVNKGTFIGVVMRPKANDVLFAGGKLADTDKTLIAPSDASIATGDRLEIDSVTYDIYGTLADWKIKLGGTVQHLSLYLKRVI
jgi:hypothetical protein